VLGLLINPVSLLDVWLEGLLIAAVLILVARPIAVLPIMKIFGFNAREASLVAWVGLRGSVPIILAIFPLMFGLEGAELIFNVVFFVVLISATIQGTTLPIVARQLRLTEKPPAVPAASLEITALEEVDADIVEYTLSDHPRAAGRRLSQMALPDTTVVAMITRGKDVIPPRGSTELMAGDHLFVVLRPETRAFIDCVFSEAVGVVSDELPDQELKLKGSTKIDDLCHSYGLLIKAEDGQTTLDSLIRDTLPSQPEVGVSIHIDGMRLTVLETLGGRITTVGLTVEKKPSE
ncbi:cation:proton antiporter domain-containing protein, partial [Halomonas sp. MES3-P3E]|uniref:cation:proton antiporter domain-containing protein n=1 Tax=Halomonas sp. MES3-P3E TaxID=2058321 RepID=UPI000CAE1F7B